MKKKEIMENHRLKILESAKELFSTKDYHQCLIEDIARKAGIGKGTFYLYFKDKKDLLAQILYKLLDELADKIRGVRAKKVDFKKQMVFLLEEVISFLNSNNSIFSVMHREGPLILEKDVQIELHKKMEVMISEIVLIMKRGIKESIFREDNPMFYAIVFTSLVHGSLFEGFKEMSVPTGKNINKKKLLDIFLYGVAKRTVAICILALFLLSQTLFAQSIFTLEDCIKSALENNPQIKVAEQKIKSARAKKLEAFSTLLPKLSLSGTYTKLSKPTFELPPGMVLPFDISPAMTSTEIYGGKLALQQPLFMSGRLYQVNRQAYFGYEVTQEEYRKTKNDLIYNVQESFYRYLLTEKTLEIADEGFAVSENHFKVTQALYNEGKASGYDVSRARVAVSNAKVNLLRVENGLKLAKQLLLNVINSEDKSMEFKGELEYIPLDYNYKDLLDSGLKNRPEIRQLEFQKKIMSGMVKMSKAEYGPSLLVSGSRDLQNAEWSSDWSTWDDRWSASLVFQISIFNGFSTYSKVRQAKANLKQTEFSSVQVRQMIELELEKTYYDYEQAKKSIEAQKENVDTAKDNLKIAEKRYALGLMSSLEVRDVQLALTQAELNYQQSLYDYNTAVAGLDRAMGK